MPKKQIITIPDDTLRNKSSEIKVFNKDIEKIALDMADTIGSYGNQNEAGVALAAVQIGYPVRLIVLKEDDEYIALANPKIVKKSKTAEEDLEGCMSVPQKYGFVMRPKKVKVSAQNLRGENLILSMDGLMARILQHEIDHLNGILFIDYITDEDKIYTLSKDGTLINKQMKML
ncbi:peptide deformylase [bacterium CG2_30_37_16]|nr:MAG: peptide deformylase [bacterium CG2_30_37_16]PIP30230.1 MAG: peptide deformylase [bacterium (Candidatus Howlettbacteria) CG23_combo_of_CG06-09_8_20_14_all_37_9]PIY00204.1 MAG: peptide deformylase [bacterium (Candidatus Howlettbacteria) CG_4_10_14_3_um_filter_37_10]PJB07240.1 MAG: peptide deformylase [bacterium (Candidatus Howlettbacteria) CG_4_9_14_3_um_filter_37_10]